MSDQDIEQAALNIYPSMRKEEQFSDRSTPYEVQQARNEDAERSIFDPAKSYRDESVKWMAPESEGMSEADRPKVLNELKQIAADYELSPIELGQIRNWAGIQEHDKPDVAKQQAEGRKRLREQYGADRADSMLQDVRRLVARDPRFSKLLDKHRLGDDPDLLMMLAEKVQSMRGRGKFK